MLTSSPAAVRDVPKVAGEYNQIDMPRFEMQTPAVRPAVIFDNISDASILALSAQGNTSTQLLRFTKVHNTLLYALQLLTPAAAFLNVEGNGKRRHYY